MVDNGDMNDNVNYHATGDPQLDKAIHEWKTWDKVSLPYSTDVVLLYNLVNLIDSYENVLARSS